MRSLLIILVLFCLSFDGMAQTANISGVINTYQSVSSISGDTLTVVSTAGFASGDKVLIIQMQGATIDETNAVTFGDIINLNEAGNYELNTVCQVLNGTQLIVNGIQRAYDPAGAVQLVSVPVYQDAVVTGVLSASPWDGTTGGVLAFECSGTLTLSADIDLQGVGFRGGAVTTSTYSCDWFSDPNDYFYNITSGVGAMKGEGIASYITNKTGGRGAQANGGGGGNDHNSGGGGGSNAGTGGQGGERIRPSTFTCRGISPGVGGKPNTYSNALNKVFLGGGGGAGHENNPATGTAGTNGGGIVLIKANQLVGNSQTIFVNGAHVNASSADGAGGAGGGGSVLLDVTNYTGSLNVHAIGGNGGNVANIGPSNCNGPGGGGGGGVLWVSQNSVPGAISFSGFGGANGTTIATAQSNCTINGNNNAATGNPGLSITNLNLPEASCNLAPTLLATSICNNDSLFLAGAWQNLSGTYYDTLNLGCCDSIVETTLTVHPPLSSTLTQTLCAGESITVNGNTYNSTVIGATEVFSNVGPNNCDSTVTINLTVLPALSSTLTQTICDGDSIVVNGTAYHSTVSGVTEVFTNVGPNQCDSTVTINLTVLPPLTNSINQTLCAGDSIVVNGTTYNSSVTGATEVISNAGSGGCDSIITIDLLVLPPLASTLNETICDGDSIVVNGTTYHSTVSGATEVFTNIGPNQCDSTVTINLTVLGAIDNSTTVAGPIITANQSGATYQWLDCDNGNAPISGETGISYTAIANGNYAVVITVGSCADTSDCVEVTGVGLTEAGVALAPELKVYPNPTRGEFSVDLGGEFEEVLVTLTDLQGRVVLSRVYGGVRVLELSLDEPGGVYFLGVEFGGSVRVVRLVRE